MKRCSSEQEHRQRRRWWRCSRCRRQRRCRRRRRHRRRRIPVANRRESEALVFDPRGNPEKNDPSFFLPQLQGCLGPERNMPQGPIS